MQNQVPNFDNEAITAVLMEFYGIEGEITPLVSFEDQNARIKTPTGSYVLKIANKRMSIEDLEMQTDVIEYLGKTASELNLPRMIPTINGRLIIIIDDFPIRLMTYLEGDILGNSIRTPALYRSIGSFMGQFSNAMKDYSHINTHRPNDIWNLDNILACKDYLMDVVNEDDRARIERCYEQYINNTQPRLVNLRKSVIHADANEQNILVTIEASPKVAGLIDFGDVQLETHVNEIAITLAYALLGVDDIEMAGREIIQGYIQAFPLEPVELEVLPNLLTMRLVQSIIMSSHSAKQFPDNDYIVISQKPALSLLKKLENEKLMIDIN